MGWFVWFKTVKTLRASLSKLYILTEESAGKARTESWHFDFKNWKAPWISSRQRAAWGEHLAAIHTYLDGWPPAAPQCVCMPSSGDRKTRESSLLSHTGNHQGMDTPHCLESITSHNSTKQNYSLLILMLKTPSPPASPQPKSYKCLAAFYRSVQVAASSSTVVWCVHCTRQLTQGKVQSEIQPVFCFPRPEPWHWHVSMWKKGRFFPTQGCSLLAKPCACRDKDA